MEAKSSKILCLFCLMLVALSATGQNLEIPQTEFALSLSNEQLELSRGKKADLEILILKSNGYRKSKAKMSVSSSLPKGITVTFSPEKGDFDRSRASIFIEPEVKPGEYLLILSATLNNKTKGTILKLLII